MSHLLSIEAESRGCSLNIWVAAVPQNVRAEGSLLFQECAFRKVFVLLMSNQPEDPLQPVGQRCIFLLVPVHNATRTCCDALKN